MKQYANLHFHSTHSDGVYTPAELARLAKAEGYAAIALADHDTVTGNAECQREAQALGLRYIFAAEFSTASESYGASFHIVGMDFDPTFAPMAEYLEHMSYREAHQTKVLFERGVANGYLRDITWEEVLAYNEGITWLCNEHVFRAMKAKGLLCDLDYGDFFKNVYGVHRNEVPDAYDFLEPHELIDLIHRAGGLAIVAHPIGQLRYLDRLIADGIDGVEVWHPDLPREEQLEALTLAIEHGLFVSGGSDHSGLMGGQYDRYEDPRSSVHWIEPRTAGTGELFFEELLTRTLSPRVERESYLADFRREPGEIF